MYDHICTMLKQGPTPSPQFDLEQLDKVFYVLNGNTGGTTREAVTEAFRPLIMQKDLLIYLTLADTRLPEVEDIAGTELPTGTGSIDVVTVIKDLGGVNVDSVASKTRFPSQAMELASMIDNDCEPSIKIGAALILLGLGIDRHRG